MHILYVVAISLLVALPANYPSKEIPVMTIHIEKGLSSDQGDELLELANRIAADNLSSPSIFTICEGIKEWLGRLIVVLLTRNV
jgi:hypothetical protein